MIRTLNITILGKLWMGGDASTTLRPRVGDGPFEVQFDNPTDLDEILAYVYTHSGDFSQIIGTEVTYQESDTTLVSAAEQGNETTTTSQTVTRTMQLSTFTEEQEERYLATLGGYDYDDEAYG